MVSIATASMLHGGWVRVRVLPCVVFKKKRWAASRRSFENRSISVFLSNVPRSSVCTSTKVTKSFCFYDQISSRCIPSSPPITYVLFLNRSARMSSTSQKHRDFVAEPMGEKPVTDLPGIGPVLGERLSAKGFDKAYVVFGQFLVLKKNEELFLDWIKETCSANAKQGGDCYTGLNEWANSFLWSAWIPFSRHFYCQSCCEENLNHQTHNYSPVTHLLVAELYFSNALCLTEACLLRSFLLLDYS